MAPFELHIRTRKDGQVPAMDLVLEGPWGSESIIFQEEIPFDFDRFQHDEIYCERVTAYIRMSLYHLAQEVLAIGLMPDPPDPGPSTFRALAQHD